MNPVPHLLKSLFAMASMVEARDPYTGGHLWRVSQFSRLLAEAGNLPAADTARIMLGGFLHDLGKIAVSDSILNKPGRLSDLEIQSIRTHPDVGQRLLADHPLVELASAAIWAHHERPDGTGYPRKLSGEEIPLDARIIAIADSFDAMTSGRPYSKGMSIARALDIVGENLGRQFDAVWGARFVGLGSDRVLEHIVGHSEPGIPLQVCPACGPIVVLHRRQADGSLVYCRHCGGEVRVARDGDSISLTLTGGVGDPAALEPDLNSELLDELVMAASAALELVAQE